LSSPRLHSFPTRRSSDLAAVLGKRVDHCKRTRRFMPDFTATDHLMMARALRLAEHGAYTTRPNPMVGCLITHGDEVVGEGYHQQVGRAPRRERGEDAEAA